MTWSLCWHSASDLCTGLGCGSRLYRCQEHDKAITLKRFEFERECRELHNQYEERMKVGRVLACPPPPHPLHGGVGVGVGGLREGAGVWMPTCLPTCLPPPLRDLFITNRTPLFPPPPPFGRAVVRVVALPPALQNLRARLEAQRAADVSVIEERKARHVAALMRAHDTAFQEIKNYYNDITHSNLDLIHSLKDELHELKRKEATDDRLMFDISQENKRMTEPLKRALADVERLTEERETYRCAACGGALCRCLCMCGCMHVLCAVGGAGRTPGCARSTTVHTPLADSAHWLVNVPLAPPRQSFPPPPPPPPPPCTHTVAALCIAALRTHTHCKRSPPPGPAPTILRACRSPPPSAPRKEMATLQRVKAKLVVGEQRLRDMQWEHEVLEQRFARLRSERDDLKEKFHDAVYDVQQKAGFKALLLRKKLDAAHSELEKKEAHLTEVRAGTAPAAPTAPLLWQCCAVSWEGGVGCRWLWHLPAGASPSPLPRRHPTLLPSSLAAARGLAVLLLSALPPSPPRVVHPV
jgi:hypothetical protein